MSQPSPISHKDIVFFEHAFPKYCVFCFGKEEGRDLYQYYHDNHSTVIPPIKSGNACGDKPFKLHMIFTRLKADVFFHGISPCFVKWPYDKGEIHWLTPELFEFVCFDFYGALGECGDKDGRAKLGFSRILLDLLLPPPKDCLFNHSERSNQNTIILEDIYAQLKGSNASIAEHYGKNFWELTKAQLEEYIKKHVEPIPQHLMNALWYCIKSE